jgi:hypothetical protein
MKFKSLPLSARKAVLLTGLILAASLASPGKAATPAPSATRSTSSRATGRAAAASS